MQLGWIDFSKEDRQKAFDVINLLSEQGAVDELGIGVIRDAFANYFFPGTSTIQTRAKYFLTSGFPDDRESAAVNSVVKDRASFVEYIAFVLGDDYVPLKR